MGKPRILIVEDDIDISRLLKLFFGNQNYDVDTALRGAEALSKASQSLPHLILLDIMLPDIDGFEVCRQLRSQTRTSHVPIIFLTQKDERSDKLQGLGLGGDDYITKPFDIEELKLRVQRAISRSQQQNLSDPRTGFPSGKLIEEQLRRIIRLEHWALIDIQIRHFAAFKEMYGFVASDDVLRFCSQVITEAVQRFGTSGDFIGHSGDENFVIITSEAAAEKLCNHLKQRFNSEIQPHYNFIDRQNGYILNRTDDFHEEKTPLMALATGIVSPTKFSFSDIREITEVAAEVRRLSVGFPQ